MTKVTLDICPELYEFARGEVEDIESFSTEDYLTGLLNMALLRELDKHDMVQSMPAPLPLVILMPEDHRIVEKTRERSKHDLFNEIEQDEGGHWRMKDKDEAAAPEQREGNGDLDDGIPF